MDNAYLILHQHHSVMTSRHPLDQLTIGWVSIYLSYDHDTLWVFIRIHQNLTVLLAMSLFPNCHNPSTSSWRVQSQGIRKGAVVLDRPDPVHAVPLHHEFCPHRAQPQKPRSIYLTLDTQYSLLAVLWRFVTCA